MIHYTTLPKGVNSEGVAPSNTAVKPGTSGMADAVLVLI